MMSSSVKYEKLTTLRDFSPQAIADEASRRVQLIKSQFETEFQPRVQQARQEGLEEGKRLGEEAARQAIKPVLDTLNHTMQACTAAQQEHLTKLEGLCFELLAIYLPQLVGSLAAQAPEALMKNSLHRVLHKVDASHQPTLFVAPEVESLTRQLCQTSEFSATLGKLVIKADANLKAGDCRMAWRNHGYEVNLQQILQEVVQELQAQASSVAATLPPEASA
jgi:flagellar biosynthesis/type III secretory pathway protein FliH